MVLARLRSLFRSWQELRTLTRQSPERLEAIIKRNEESSARSHQQLQSIQQNMAAPLERAEAVSAQLERQRHHEAAAPLERVAAELEKMNIDVFALQQNVRRSGSGGRSSGVRGGSRAAAAVVVAVVAAGCGIEGRGGRGGRGSGDGRQHHLQHGLLQRADLAPHLHACPTHPRTHAPSL